MSLVTSQRVKVKTNAFEITSLPKVVVVQYTIRFEPEIKGNVGAERKQRYIDHLQVSVAPNLFPTRIMYDGGGVAFAPVNVATLIGEERSFFVRFGSPGEVNPHEFKPKVKERNPCIKITFTKNGAVPVHPNEVRKTLLDNDSGRRESITNLLQMIIRQGTNNRFATRGKAYYDLTSMHKEVFEPLGDSKLHLRRGIWHSARPGDGRVILMVDTVTTAFFPGGRLPDVIANFLGTRDIWRLDDRNNRNDWMKMTRYFKSLRIKVTVPASSAQVTKTIRGFEVQGGLYQFDYQGETITVQDYYRMVYQTPVRFPKAPGVIVKLARDFKAVVPIEFCELLPGQIFKQKIPEEFTRAMVKFSSVRPDLRLKHIVEAARKYRDQENMVQMDMNVDSNPLIVAGNLYPAPNLVFGEAQEMRNITGGKWNILRRKFILPTKMTRWFIINCVPGEASSQQIGELVQNLSQACSDTGMAFAPPLHVENCPQGAGLSQRLQNLFDKAVSTEKHQLESQKGEAMPPDVEKKFRADMVAKIIFLVILPSSAADLRAAVKHWGDIKTGVQTQCLRSTGRGGIKRDSQYVNNLLLKINARSGGINFSVSSSPAFNFFHTIPTRQDMNPKMIGGNTIIFGADVSHPGPGVFGKPSVTGIVFSVNLYGSQYAAITGIQKPRLERIENLSNMVVRALNTFAGAIKGPPINIIFYRDGLSEGEFERTARDEIKEIQEAITKFMAGNPHGYSGPNAAPRPKLTYTVVGKRHHALLFPDSEHSFLNDRGNCKAGVAVHEGITQPHRYLSDFYLQSHSAIQGTSRSSHYVVLHDEIFGRTWPNKLTEALEEYSFALCHMYAKATRSVSIPAPVYYADLVCQRGAFHMDASSTSLRFEDDSAASEAGSSTRGSEFPIDAWRQVFKEVHPGRKGSMYFL